MINTEYSDHSELLKAIVNNAPFEDIKRIIESGANLNETFKNEWTITHYAVAIKNPQIFKKYLFFFTICVRLINSQFI